jgi:hypothetical protein
MTAWIMLTINATDFENQGGWLEGTADVDLGSGQIAGRSHGTVHLRTRDAHGSGVHSW